MARVSENGGSSGKAPSPRPRPAASSPGDDGVQEPSVLAQTQTDAGSSRWAPWSSSRSRTSRRRWVGGLIGALVAVIGLVVGLSALFGGFSRTGGGNVDVVRNGGPFDNTRVRQVLPPNSSRRWTGMFSVDHKYPAQQRFYTVTSDPSRGDRSGVDVINVPTSDGVDVGIEATVYFTLTSDPGVLRSFDDRYGTRTYTGLDGSNSHAWEGDEGWSNFLDQIVRPVIENDLRAQIGDVRCADLVSSCALVQNSTKPVATTANANNVNITKVQNGIDSSLESDIAQTLGGPYLTNIRFNLSRVTLPPQVQDAVNRAQSAFADVSQAQARLRSAQVDAQTNAAKQQGYQRCPICGQLDLFDKLRGSGITVYAPGSNSSLALPTK
jgi:regulator of protease activity HflC (stomatin/prohibitin superfamily)